MRPQSQAVVGVELVSVIWPLRNRCVRAMTATQAAPGSLPLPPLVMRPDPAARRDLHRPDERSALAVQHLLALLATSRCTGWPSAVSTGLPSRSMKYCRSASPHRNVWPSASANTAEPATQAQVAKDREPRDQSADAGPAACRRALGRALDSPLSGP